MRINLFIYLFVLVFVASTLYGEVTLDVTLAGNNVDNALDLLGSNLQLAGLNMNMPNFAFLGTVGNKLPVVPVNDFANGTDKVTISYALDVNDCQSIQLSCDAPQGFHELKVDQLYDCWFYATTPFWTLITDPLDQNSEIIILTNVQDSDHIQFAPYPCLNGYCNSPSGLAQTFPAGSTLSMVDFREIAYFLEFPVQTEDEPQLVMQEYPGGLSPGPIIPLITDIDDLQFYFGTDNDNDGELDNHNGNGQYGDPGDYIGSPFTPPFSDEDIRAVRVQIEDNFCYTILSVPFSLSSLVPQSEVDSIIDLYNSTDGDNWNYTTNWFEGSSGCDWFGVKCTNDHISNLVLSSNNLIGFLPQSLTTLSELRYLLLSNNQLTGNIPSFNLTSASTLLAIALYSNNLSGNIPSGLFPSGSNLFHFKVQSNKLEGEIPSEMLNCLNFEDNGLDLRWNALYTNNIELRTFLNEYQITNDWESTQTVVPTNLNVGPSSYTWIFFYWTPILFTEYTGGYEMYYSLFSGGPYEYFGTTSSKSDSSIIVTDLAPGRTYYFVIRTISYPHENNDNTVYSEFSEELVSSTFPSSINLQLFKSGNDIELDWTPSYEPNDIFFTTSLDIPFSPLTEDVLSPDYHIDAVINNESQYFYVILPQDTYFDIYFE